MLAFESAAAARARWSCTGSPPRPQPVASGERQVRPVGGADASGARAAGEPAGIDGVLEYASDLFERATASRRWASGWSGCWTAAAADAARPIGALDILEPAERAHHPAGLERHRGRCHRPWRRTDRRDAAGAVCRAGRAHAGCRCGGLRGPHAQLRRAGRPRQPSGASPARARRRARDRGRALRRALARDGDRAPRHPQSRRRLPAARPGTTRASGSASCWATPAPPCW